MTSQRGARRLAVVAASISAWLLLPGVAAGHAELVRAIPADGATVEGTPEEISATFSEPLETDGSTLSLRNTAGERLAVGRVDADDRTRLIIDPVPELVVGTYEVRWQAATADGHIERDTWSFTVAAALKTPGTPTPSESARASAGATPSPTPSPAASPTPSPSPAPGGSTSSLSDVALPIVAALAIVLVGASALLRRGRRP
jgi:methionine-rich copper-binding protein CopC